MQDSAATLEGLMMDKEEVVQVAAAEVLCRLEKTPAELKAHAIERLLKLADQSTSSYLVAVAALNALDRQRNLLDAQAIKYISGLPDKAVGRLRGTAELEKLKTRFQPSQ